MGTRLSRLSLHVLHQCHCVQPDGYHAAHLVVEAVDDAAVPRLVGDRRRRHISGREYLELRAALRLRSDDPVGLSSATTACRYVLRMLTAPYGVARPVSRSPPARRDPFRLRGWRPAPRTSRLGTTL